MMLDRRLGSVCEPKQLAMDSRLENNDGKEEEDAVNAKKGRKNQKLWLITVKDYELDPNVVSTDVVTMPKANAAV